MKQCPNSYLADIWPMVRWWIDWRRFKSLPFGGSDVLSQPQFVVDVMRTAENTLAEISERNRAKSIADQEKMLEQLKRKGRRR